MSKRATTLIAALFAAGSMFGNPAWADRGNARFDHRNAHFEHRNAHSDRGNFRFERGHGHVPNAWGWGLGLLAGSAVLLAATQPRQVVVAPSFQAYAPPPAPLAVYSEPSQQWWYYCAESAAYYPHVRYCPSGWARTPAMPPR